MKRPNGEAIFKRANTLQKGSEWTGLSVNFLEGEIAAVRLKARRVFPGLSELILATSKMVDEAKTTEDPDD